MSILSRTGNLCCFKLFRTHVKYDSQFNLAALKKEKHIYSFSPLAAEVAKFVYHVAAGCKTDFACSGSGSTLAKATDYLQSIGYNQDFLDYYYRKASSIDNQLIGCLLMDRPVCVGGKQVKEMVMHGYLMGYLQQQQTELVK